MFRETLGRIEASTEENGEGPTADPDALAVGVQGGVFATLVMTVYRMPIARSPPPTAEFIEQYVPGVHTGDHPIAALVLHFLYGIGGGLVFGMLHPHRPTQEHEPETWGFFWGMVYGIALSVFGERVVIGRLLGQNLSEDESLIFHAGHLVYGVALGAWVGSRG